MEDEPRDRVLCVSVITGLDRMSATARAERDELERSPAPIENGPVAVISMGGRGGRGPRGGHGGRADEGVGHRDAGFWSAFFSSLMDACKLAPGARRRCGITGRNTIRPAPPGCGVDPRAVVADADGIDEEGVEPTAEPIRLGTMLVVRPGAGTVVPERVILPFD